MDYKDTLNLPKTTFPMKANLTAKEPEILALWEKMGIYHRIREASRGRQTYILHDGPPYANGNIHLGTALKRLSRTWSSRPRTCPAWTVSMSRDGTATACPSNIRSTGNWGSSATR